MSNQIDLYDEKRAAQLVALLIYINKKPINMLKLVKLVYNIDREALKRWSRPVTFDSFCSMENGQVVSKIYDNVKFENKDLENSWNFIFETKKIAPKRYEVKLREPYKKEFIDQLSNAEIKLAVEIFNRYKDKDVGFMIDEHHNPELFPEYVKTSSSVSTEYDYLLEKIGIPQKHRKKISEDFESLRYLATIS
jgi:hypothetical protein